MWASGHEAARRLWAEGPGVSRPRDVWLGEGTARRAGGGPGRGFGARARLPGTQCPQPRPAGGGCGARPRLQPLTSLRPRCGKTQQGGGKSRRPVGGQRPHPRPSAWQPQGLLSPSLAHRPPRLPGRAQTALTAQPWADSAPSGPPGPRLGGCSVAEAPQPPLLESLGQRLWPAAVNLGRGGASPGRTTQSGSARMPLHPRLAGPGLRPSSQAEWTGHGPPGTHSCCPHSLPGRKNLTGLPWSEGPQARSGHACPTRGSRPGLGRPRQTPPGTGMAVIQRLSRPLLPGVLSLGESVQFHKALQAEAAGRGTGCPRDSRGSKRLARDPDTARPSPPAQPFGDLPVPSGPC